MRGKRPKPFSLLMKKKTFLLGFCLNVFLFLLFIHNPSYMDFHRFFCSTKIYFPVAGATITTRRSDVCVCALVRRREVFVFCHFLQCVFWRTRNKKRVLQTFLPHTLLSLAWCGVIYCETYFLLFVVKSMLIAYINIFFCSTRTTCLMG